MRGLAMRGDFDEDEYDDEEESCYACEGEGFYHDCGEDTCCCVDTDTQYVYVCGQCRGTGVLR